jgi:hypothetical protein
MKVSSLWVRYRAEVLAWDVKSINVQNGQELKGN